MSDTSASGGPKSSTDKRALLQELLAQREQQASARGTPLAPRPDSSTWPLSFAQERILVIEALEPGTATHNVPMSMRIKGPVDPVRLAAAYSRLVERHPVLRATFAAERGQTVQRISAPSPQPLQVTDLSAGPPADAEAEVLRRLDADALTPFDLGKGPLVRASLIKVAADDWAMIWTIHHIVTDGLSSPILVKDLMSFYGQGEAMRTGEPALQYADYAHWQRSSAMRPVLDAQLAYWKRQLDGANFTLALPTDRVHGPRPSAVGAEAFFELSPRVAEAATALAQQRQATQYMVLQAAYFALLHHYSEQQDLVVGTVVSGRSRPELTSVAGPFINPVALRGKLTRTTTFNELLAQVRQTCLDAFANAEVPFEQVVNAVNSDRDASRHPLFQTIFELQGTPGSVTFEGLGLTPIMPRMKVSRIEMSWLLFPMKGGLFGRIEYSSELFDADSVKRMARHFGKLLEACCAAPDAPIGRVAFMDETEGALVGQRWSKGPSSDIGELSFEELFLAQAERTPGHVAVEYLETALTYRELADASLSVAGGLHQNGVRQGDVVALFSERTPNFLSAMIGTFHTGAAYVPLDPQHPAARLADVLGRSHAKVVLVSERYQAAATEALAEMPADRRPRLLPIDVTGPELSPLPKTSLRELAYVIFTSGSTGTPKGVMIERRGLVNHLQAKIRDMQLGPSETVAQNASQCFDISIWQFLVALMLGGRTRIFPEETARDPRELMSEVERTGVTILQLVPSMLRAVLDLPMNHHPSLRAVWWVPVTGEALPGELVTRWHQAYPGIPLLNCYGATELSDDISHGVFAEDCNRAIAHLGKPVHNAAMYVMNGSGDLAPIGIPGEVVVAGEAAIGRGYLDDPVRTAISFIPNPFAETPGERLYRIGDRARWRADGTMDFLGRVDFQVKVRGHRIELGEVESALLKCEGVRQAVVIARDDVLVAYVVPHPGATLASEALRAPLKRSLPEYMVPAVVIELPELPLNSNGKIDRKRLPAPELTATGSTQVAPRNAYEELVASAFGKALELNRVGALDDFFALGGHSLLAVQVVSALRESAGIELPLRTVFEEPTVEKLARALQAVRAEKAGVKLPAVTPMVRNGQSRASFAQERLWFVERTHPGDTGFNVVDAFKVAGDLNLGALNRSLQELLKRHEVLRSTFAEVDGQLIQRLLPAPEIQLAPTDLSALGPAEQKAKLQALVEAADTTAFDLERGPLYGIKLLKLSAQEHVLLWTFHHAVMDGFTLLILLQDLGALYALAVGESTTPLPAPKLQYSDYAEWQRKWFEGGGLKPQLDYWTKQLSGAVGTINVPTDRARQHGATGQGKGGYTARSISKLTAAALERLGRDRGVTQTMLHLAAFSTLIHRLGGDEELCIGIDAQSRPSPELERVAGMFLNLLVLRIQTSAKAPFTDLVGQVRDVALSAYSNQDVPFEHVVEALNPSRTLSRTPLFQLAFDYQPYSSLEETSRFKVFQVKAERSALMGELYLRVRAEREGLIAQLIYDETLFDRETADAILHHYEQLLSAVVAAPTAPLEALSMLADHDRKTIVEEWNRSARNYPKAQTFEALFQAQAKRSPHECAIEFEGQKLTFQQVHEAATGVAAALVEAGVGRGHLVALLSERSPDLMIAMLGTFYAGAAYVPLDPDHPALRLANVVGRAKPTVLMSSAACDRQAAELCATPDLKVKPRRLALNARSAPKSLPTASPNDLAYVIFTSGSTGVPKGVMVERQGMLNHLFAKVNDLELSPHDCISQTASQCFDISVWQFFSGALVGARTRIVPDATTHDPQKLLSDTSAGKVTVLEVVPSMLTAMLEVTPTAQMDLSRLRWMVCTGEALTGALCQSFAQRYPRIPVVNAYGPTECSDDVTHAILPKGTTRAAAPVGKPIQNTRIYVLDPAGQVTPAGVPGELFVGGDGVGRGYLDDPERTAEAFVPDPFGPPGARLYRTGDRARWLHNGDLEFLGRLDFQVKVRGHRIELGEVETALSKCPGVKQALALATSDGLLVGYVVPAAGSTVQPTEVRAQLRQSLPESMVPGVVLAIPELPLTSNGKIDRKRLPKPTQQQAEAGRTRVAPRSPHEELVAGVWAKVLGIPAPGALDNFFEVGGHSLKLVALSHEYHRATGTQLGLSELVRNQTVAAPASLLGTRRRAADAGQSAKSALTPLRAGTPTAFAIHAMLGDVLLYELLAPLLPPGVGLVALEAPELRGAEPLLTFEARAKAYVQLIRAHQPKGPYHLVGYSNGGAIAWEMASQLLKAGERVATLALIDPSLASAQPADARLDDVVTTKSPFGSGPPDELAIIEAFAEGFFEAPARATLAATVSRDAKRAFAISTIAAMSGITDSEPAAVLAQAATVLAINQGQAAYRYPPLDQAVDILLSAENAPGFQKVADGWKALARKGYQTHALAGTHRDLISFQKNGPLAVALAGILSRNHSA